MRVTWVLMAGEEPTVWSWVGFAVIAVLLIVAGRWVARKGNEMNRRQRQEIELRRELVAAVPGDLRPSRPPLGPAVVVVVVVIAAAFVGGMFGGEIGALLAATVVLGVAVSRMHRAREQEGREADAIARTRSAGMTEEQHGRLMAGLDVLYDRPVVRTGPVGSSPTVTPPPAIDDDAGRLVRRASSPAPGPTAEHRDAARVAVRVLGLPATVGLVAGGLAGNGEHDVKFILAVIFVSMVFALTMLDRVVNETTRALLGLGACFAPVAGWGLGSYLFP